MLCQFTVKNFQCIKDEATLDMQAVNISENVESLLVDQDGERFLPIAAIYGPNGGGKSTVLIALMSLVWKVMRPIHAATNESLERRHSNTKLVPFLFSKDTIDAPTEFELFFRTAGYEYQYNLSVLKEMVISECLRRKAITGKRYALVFSRDKENVKLVGSLAKYDCSAVSDTLPLLSFLGITHKRNRTVQDITNWFEESFIYVNYSDPHADIDLRIASSGKLKKLVLKMMREMDIDVSEYDIEFENGSDKIKQITTYHTVGEKSYKLNFEDESSGTVKLFGILPYIAESLMSGAALVIDELDAKLHPALLKYIIHLFTDPESNRNGAQLIFTSHDLSTMNSETFRRDEIWFIAKNEEKASQLYSLIEFKNPDNRIERKDASFDKRYLEGRYGADPYLQKIIDWGEY